MQAEDHATLRPPLVRVAQATREAARYLDRAVVARGGGYVNAEGGDVGMHGSLRSVVRHTVHYLAAAELAEAGDLDGPVLDVGSGVGALAAWMADRLDLPLHLADHDTGVLTVASRAFPTATIHASLDGRSDWASLVSAMEVVEHVPPDQQLAFVGQLFRQLAPGGLLVVSTPDESGYPGGWSGYAPHVGCVDAPGLAALLQDATDVAPTVWRLEGEVFTLHPVRAYTEAALNRLWSGITRRAPGLAERLGGGTGRIAPSHTRLTTGRIPEDVRAVPADQGTGTGLLGILTKPA